MVQITDDGSRTLVDPATDVAFHSGCGALAETATVYLRHGGVRDRVADRLPTRILEIGVGLGLGLLMSVDLAAGAGVPLRYVGIENDWLPADVLEQLDYGSHLSDPRLFDRWLDWRRSVDDGERSTTTNWGDGVWVTILRQDFASIDGDDVTFRGSFDAIYFDPFDPAVDDDLWSEGVFRSMHRCLASDGRLTTYCVRRSIRDRMAAAGFAVERVPGPPGGKREVLVARPT